MMWNYLPIWRGPALALFYVVGLLPAGPIAAAPEAPVPACLAECNVVWTSPSTGAAGSMPIGNGDLAANVWVEGDGDVVLLLAKTDAWSGNGRLLKLGRVRVVADPPLVNPDKPFRQELVLADGEVRVRSGAEASAATVRLWVDANRPVVHVEVDSASPRRLSAQLELWRTERKKLPAHEKHSAYGISNGPEPVTVEPDTVLPARGDRIVWYHRNPKSCYEVTLRQQGLGKLLTKYPDPLLGRTFGCVLTGDGLRPQGQRALASGTPARRHHVRIVAWTDQTPTAQAWVTRAEALAAETGKVDFAAARAAHQQWWRAFWGRSWIFASASPAAVQQALAGASRAMGRGVPGTDLPLRIGADTSRKAGNRFLGRMARVRVYDRALAPDRVAVLAHEPRGAALGPQPHLVAAWRLVGPDHGAYANLAARPTKDAPPDRLAARVVGKVRTVTDGGAECVEFGGQGYLEVPRDPRLDLADGFTLEAWIAPGLGGKATSGRVLDRAVVATPHGWLLDVHPGNALRVITRTGTLGYGGKIAPGTWVHVAATYDPRTDTRRLYVNGKAVEGTESAGTSGGGAASGGLATVTRGYQLQRYIHACAGRGAYPIKFNGTLFTVNGGSGAKAYDPDYRRWGGCYWFQNTRLPYWSMLAAGDYDLMAPLFGMYMRALPMSRDRTRIYFKHGGAHFPETMYFWGTPNNDNYGWRRKNLPVGLTTNTYIRRYWQGGIELAVMMSDRYRYTRDAAFARNVLVPFAAEILTFFDEHWPRGKDGTIRFEPAQSLETWHTAVNPLPEIAGLQYLIGRMLALPEDLTTAGQRERWRKLLADLPPLPTGTDKADGPPGKPGRYVKPADTYGRRSNSENPELYAVWPYRLFGVGRPELDVGRRTFARRRVKRTGGWSQDPIQAAYLGLTAQAARDVWRNFHAKDPRSRFPVFWGPNFDWVPDQDHGSVAMMALQHMLLQARGQRIFLLPAWPVEWDVDFCLHAPGRTVVRCVWREGKLQKLTVTPAARRKDIVLPEQR